MNTEWMGLPSKIERFKYLQDLQKDYALWGLHDPRVDKEVKQLQHDIHYEENNAICDLFDYERNEREALERQMIEAARQQEIQDKLLHNRMLQNVDKARAGNRLLFQIRYWEGDSRGLLKFFFGRDVGVIILDYASVWEVREVGSRFTHSFYEDEDEWREDPLPDDWDLNKELVW